MAQEPWGVYCPYNPWRLRKELFRFCIKIWIETKPEATHEYYRAGTLRFLHELDISKKIPLICRLLIRPKVDLSPSKELDNYIIRNPIPETERTISKYLRIGNISKAEALVGLRLFILLWPAKSRAELRDWFVKEISEMPFFPLAAGEWEGGEIVDSLPPYKEKSSFEGKEEEALPQNKLNSDLD